MPVQKAMHSIHNFEIGWIATIQGNAALREVMIWFSYLGSEALPFVLAFVYFTLSKSAGSRLYLLFPWNRAILQVLKIGFHLPRPYWIDSRVEALSGSGGYGMPSGHVLSASIVWPFVAKTLDKFWAWSIALTIVILVSVSRVYLGVHFVSDVVGAWIVAVGLHWSFYWAESRLSPRLQSSNLAWQMGTALCATSALVVIGFGVKTAIAGISDPPVWSMYSAGARDLSGLLRAAGEFFGASCGIVLSGRWACFEVRGALWKRGSAFAYALAGAWIIRELARIVPSAQTEDVRLAFSFFHGVGSNLWILFFAPWILLKMGLLHQEPPSPH